MKKGNGRATRNRGSKAWVPKRFGNSLKSIPHEGRWVKRHDFRELERCKQQ